MNDNPFDSAIPAAIESIIPLRKGTMVLFMFSLEYSPSGIAPPEIRRSERNNSFTNGSSTV
jgi:hypothetical protein